MSRRALTRAAAVVPVVLGLLAGVLSTPAFAYQHRDWGHTWAMDRTLKPRCHDYTYRYHLDPPPGDWVLETFLVDPTGEKIAHGGFLKGTDPTKGTGIFRICKPNTRPGTFTIKGKVTVHRGDEVTKGWIEPSRFRLSKR